jgi:hypothetical protein
MAGVAENTKYQANTKVFTAILDAEFDEDGDMDGGDFLTWQRGFGITTGAQQADGDATGEYYSAE